MGNKISKIYVGTNQVRPAGGGGGGSYTPTANTLAYYPFKSNTLDQTGNSSLTNNRTSAVPQSNGILFTLVNNNVAISSLPNAKFISMWFNIQSMADNYCLIGALKGGYEFYYYHHDYDAGLNNRIGIFVNSSFTKVTSNQLGVSTNEWHNVCLGFDGNGSVGYLDGQQVFQTSSQPYGNSNQITMFGTWDRGITCEGILSECIIENACWTSSQVSNYYNAHKSEYGIS